jgi:hypothetical protein
VSTALDTEEECFLTLLPRSMCSHCRNLDDRPAHGRHALIQVKVWVVARFPGMCANCRRWWNEGDRIGRPTTEYDVGGWVCQECGS